MEHRADGLAESTNTKPTLDELESPDSEHASPVSLKRKRDSNASTTAPVAPPPYTNHLSTSAAQFYASPSTLPATEPTSASPHAQNTDVPWDQRQYTAHAPAPILNNPYASQPQPQPVYDNEARPGLLDYVFQKQNPPNGTKRHHLIQRAQRDSTKPVNRPHLSPLANGSASNRYSVNAYTGDPVHFTNSLPHSPSTQSPNIYPQQPSWHDYKAASAAVKRQNGVATAAVDRQDGDGVEGGVNLFDQLPRKKQKQIFAIIGELQSGIRAARQTAGDLQRQLDVLQEALGIGTDGDDER